MTLLAHKELLGLLEQGVVEGCSPHNVNSTSIDITLGRKVLYEHNLKAYERFETVFLKNRDPLILDEHDLEKSAFELYPGDFVLAQSEQVFNLPLCISAEYKLKSSLARSGLEHLNAGWCDAGWHGSVLTLELKNMTRNHILVLERGMPIGQMVFFKHALVPADRSYAARGRYNNDKVVKGIKE